MVVCSALIAASRAASVQCEDLGNQVSGFALYFRVFAFWRQKGRGRAQGFRSGFGVQYIR
jgi:hypothetical protein